ncbi:MAG: hypothetical protein ACXWBN_12115 [Acidimicrobiales bacterium]
MRKSIAAVAAFVLASSVGAGIAGVAQAAPPDKVTICHGTASDTNPYVEVTVSATSFKDGHFDGVPNPSHGDNNHPDFILQDGRTCADGPGGGGGGA